MKIKRAKRHLDELAGASRELPRRRNYYFVFAKPEPGKLQIEYLSHNPMPLELGGIVGDVVHNIWSAFDYVAVVISSPPFGKANPARVYFPTGKNRQEFIRARDGYRNAETGRWIKGKMQGAGPDAMRIVEELEPYGGGKYSIRALHDLEIADKHKLIVPTISHLHADELELMFGDKTISLRGTDFQSNVNQTDFAAIIDSSGLVIE